MATAQQGSRRMAASGKIDSRLSIFPAAGNHGDLSQTLRQATSHELCRAATRFDDPADHLHRQLHLHPVPRHRRHAAGAAGLRQSRAGLRRAGRWRGDRFAIHGHPGDAPAGRAPGRYPRPQAGSGLWPVGNGPGRPDVAVVDQPVRADLAQRVPAADQPPGDRLRPGADGRRHGQLGHRTGRCGEHGAGDFLERRRLLRRHRPRSAARRAPR
ncbi:hypothetical protein D3C78_1299920 [compost metagenome]